MFSLKDVSEVETVPNASEFLGDTLNIWDDDSALVCCVRRGSVSCRCPYYRVNEFIWVFTEHQIMSYDFDFVVKILLIFTYDLRSVDQIVDDSPFYVMWVVGFKV
jgi:hypothetical protein